MIEKVTRFVDEIIIHCSDTPKDREVSVNTIRSWHKMRGFSDIGYHYIVHLDGRVSLGRNVMSVGSHCLGHNTHSIGICYVGGGDGVDTRTQAQRTALWYLVRYLCNTFPITSIQGHRDYNSGKRCPCFDARAEYSCLLCR